MEYKGFIDLIKGRDIDSLKNYLINIENKNYALSELSSALSKSLEFRDGRIFRDLIEFGVVEFNLQKIDSRTMCYLSIFGEAGDLAFLLDKDLIDLDNGKIPDNFTCVGICNDHYNFINSAISHGLVNINGYSRVSGGESFVSLAAGRGNYDITKLLIENGADYKKLDDQGNSIFDAIKQGKRKYPSIDHDKIFKFIQELPDDYMEKRLTLSDKELALFNIKRRNIKALNIVKIRGHKC